MRRIDMTTRRNVVGRAAVAIAGLAGIGVAARASDARPAGVKELTLYGRSWRTNTDRGGALLAEGDRISVRGELVDEKEERIGEFFAAGFAVGGGVHPAQGERLELHTFKLRDGTIIGSGTAGALDGAFAIIGGTGRYAAARGTYVAEQWHQDFGGDGSAKFVLRLRGDDR
jgi:hypothetical protein